ncbi:MAG: pantoate--beta-alanine ligase [Candidatus Omnitrophica bacterium]|nr:pantoate--beta-alanine ligase [Candidatus Omnitrophota bacterium]
MKIITHISEMQQWTKENGGHSIGLVPTMGALHEGHLSLVRAARKESGRVVASIFVNPTQFGPKEDLKNYPRPIARDRKLLDEEKVDVLFYPSAREMYPDGFQTEVRVKGLTEGLCGKFRPVHFAGMTTVVAKLFNAVLPAKAYFGAKDYQQAMVVKRMVRDLNFPVEIRMLETVRERDGLAMSSRNAYLNRMERIKAPMVNLALDYAEALIRQGLRDTDQIQTEIRGFLKPFVSKIDYIEVVHPENLMPIRRFQGTGLLAIACYIGATRLIDNRLVNQHGTKVPGTYYAKTTS